MRLRGHVPFRETSLNQAKHYCKLGEDPCNRFTVAFINDYIGEGTFAAVPFSKGDFLLEYRGELITYKEAEYRERQYPPSKGSFLYFFRYNGTAKCIDATNYVGYGRKVNDVCHPTEANCAMKVVDIGGVPHLCLFATKEIQPDCELRFDYGVDSLPWRQKKPTKRPKFGTLSNVSFAGLLKRPRLCYEGTNDAIDNIEALEMIPASQAVEVVTVTTNHENRNEGNDEECSTSDNPADGILQDEIIPESDIESDDDRLIKVVRNVTNSICVDETSPVSSPAASDDSDNDHDYIPEDNDSDDSEVFALYHNGHGVSASTKTKQSAEDTQGTSLGNNGVSASTKTKQSAEDTQGTSLGNNDCLPSTSERPLSKHDRPKRYCPFCSKGFCQGRLKRHIIQVHKNINNVQEALKLGATEQASKFSSFRKQGIFLINKERMSENACLERERKQGDHPLVICSNCKGFFAKQYFAKHKTKCNSQHKANCSSLPAKLFSESEKYPSFTSEVLSKFAADEVGNLCQSDPFIIDYGLSTWSSKKGKEKKHESRKSVMQNMRRLALLYLKYKEHAETNTTDTGTAMDMFRRSSFKSLEHSINDISKYDDDTIKSGVKIALKFLIPNAASILESNYLISGEDAKAEEVAKFITVFNMKKKSMFCDATYQIEKARQTKLRKPNRLPLENDLIKVRSYTRDSMSKLVNNKNLVWGSREFKLLRDTAVARLTLFNARRGGEPCRLLLQEWEDAERGAWVDKTLTTKLDSLEEKLLKTTKIAYQAGKGNKLVSLLIPEDTVPAMRKLADPSVREASGVHADNIFLFAYTQMSLSHPSGWQCVNNVSKSADVECVDNLTATGVRHRTSTLFAAMDLTNFERQQFFKHMGHAESVNETSYQAPLAVTAVVKVGKQLHRIDKGNIGSQSTSESDEDYASSADLDQEPAVIADATNVSAEDIKDKRSYFRWSPESTNEVTEYFKTYIHEEGERCCGSLPGVDELQLFLRSSNVLDVVPEEQKKLQLLRTKIFNERKSFRSCVRKRIEKMTT